MASTGALNFQRNWQGQGNMPTTVKKSTTVYSKDDNGKYVAAGSLSKGDAVTYLDGQGDGHTKAAFQSELGVVYANIDIFVKPKSAQSVAISLGPSSFGLANRTFNSVNEYYIALTNALIGRTDIPGELFDYVNELLDYVNNGSGSYTGIDFSSFNWGQLQNYYAEVIGPIACCKRGLLNGLVDTLAIGSAKIFMPPDSERLYDYKVIIGKDEHMISAKVKSGASNQVKPQFVVDAIVNSGRLNQFSSSKEFQILQVLKDNTVAAGGLLAWNLVEPNVMTSAAVASISAIYRGNAHSKKVPDAEAIEPFRDKYFPTKKVEDLTIGEVRYRCEALLQAWSRAGLANAKFKEMFEVYLTQTQVIYVKLGLNKTAGTPTFSADAGLGGSLSNVYLRTSNSANRTADKVGYQVG